MRSEKIEIYKSISVSSKHLDCVPQAVLLGLEFAEKAGFLLHLNPP